jgi:hypothetical protein
MPKDKTHIPYPCIEFSDNYAKFALSVGFYRECSLKYSRKDPGLLITKYLTFGRDYEIAPGKGNQHYFYFVNVRQSFLKGSNHGPKSMFLAHDSPKIIAENMSRWVRNMG